MKFIIATGGSGGHLFPAIKVAQELRSSGHEIKFLGSFQQSREQMIKTGLPFEDLGAKGIVFAFRREALCSLTAMNGAVWKAFRSLRAFRPDVVLGFGGYGAFPVVFSAALLNYPTMIHEQNVIPGRANALLAKCVKRIAISFQKSSGYFNPKKTIITGCPCHLPKKDIDRSSALKEFRLQEDKTTVLVVGGSQGSRRINAIFIDVLKELKEKLNIQVIHISGKEGYRALQEEYHKLGIPFALFEFLDKMEEAYHVADLVISRSGAVTVSEIANFRLPAIFIPYPYARGHQKANASVLCEMKLARLIEDKDLTSALLSEAIGAMVREPQDRYRNEKSFESVCFPDAAQRLAREAVLLGE